MRQSAFLLVFLVFRCSLECDLSTMNTWFVAENVDYLATVPTEPFQNSTFYQTTTDSSRDKVYYLSTKLYNPNATQHNDQVNPQTFLFNNQTCGQTDSHVQGCVSHCRDKSIELVVLEASTNGSDVNDVSRQIYRNLFSTNYIVITSQIDLSNSGQLVSYSYFDDWNFCSVYVKVKLPSMFPYALFTTVQRVS